MFFFLLPLVIASTLNAPLAAQAFWVGEHTKITAQAILGLQRCSLLPKDWDEGLNAIINDADIAEDTNLLRKWSRYSHYYNPTKKLNMRRDDSSVTVEESQQTLDELAKGGSAEGSAIHQGWELVGRIVHHVQDVTVPAHVVPVAHFWNDGFEAYAVGKDPLDGSPLCPAAPDLAPLGLFQANALGTLGALEESFPYLENGTAKTLSWTEAFWVQGPGMDFGSYGRFGNQFGVPSFSDSAGNLIQIAPAVFDAFKRKQLSRAVLGTQQAILWWLKRR